MINLAKAFIYFLLFLLAINLNAQNEETDFVKAAQQKIQVKFPHTYVLNFEYNQFFARDFDSELLGKHITVDFYNFSTSVNAIHSSQVFKSP